MYKHRKVTIIERIFITWNILTSTHTSRYQHQCSAMKTRLTWVNGIAHNLDHMEEGCRPISARFNTKVDFCYNPTSMATENDYIGFLGDLSQAGFQKLGKITQEVETLVDHLRNALKVVGKNGKVVHIAHSQGAIITALAAKNLTKSEMKQIEVLAFGGGTAITRDEFPHFSRVVNYYAINDPLLFIVPAAARALRTGFAFSRISGEQEFVFLTPRIGDPAQDHGLCGDTYLEALAWEGRRYQIIYQNLVIRTMRPLSLGLTDCISGALSGGYRNLIMFVCTYILPVLIRLWNKILLLGDSIVNQYRRLHISYISSLLVLARNLLEYFLFSCRHMASSGSGTEHNKYEPVPQ